MTKLIFNFSPEGGTHRRTQGKILICNEAIVILAGRGG